MKTNTVADIRAYFVDELANERFTLDKTGEKTIELIGASFVADEEFIFGTPNQEYIKHEIDWYESMSNNINDIYGEEREPPKAWQYAANKYGEINSNYGLLIYSTKYYMQYHQVLSELMNNPIGRRATMIYTRPSIWEEYRDENGKSDFICTNAVTYYIRDFKLHAVVQMRSNDVVFGFRNDYSWQKNVLDNLVFEINQKNPAVVETFNQDVILEAGDIYWQVQNLHVYEKHFHLVK